MPTHPERLGPYLVEKPIGKGGMGIVYLASDPELNRHVAIKVLAPELAADPGCVARFKREAASLARIRHPNLVHIYAVGHDAGRHYIAMEYVRGLSLARILRQRGRLHYATALSIFAQVAAALEKVHAAGIVHRDIKPGNIMIDEDHRAILMDFGLAKPPGDRSVTTANTLVGTPEYMAPELAEGEEADFRSDIYSLAIVLFEMLTGTPPFRGRSSIQTLRQHVEAPVPSIIQLAPGVPETLEAPIAKALAKKRSERYQSVREFAAALHAAVPAPELASLLGAGHTPETAPTLAVQTPGEQPTAPTVAAAETGATEATVGAGSRKRRRLLVAAGLAAVAAVAIAVGAIVLRSPAPGGRLFIVVTRKRGAVSGRLVQIEGQDGDAVLMTANGEVRIPYRQITRIEPVPGEK